MTRIWMRRTVFAVKLKTEWNCLADLLQVADEEMKLDEEEMVDEASHGVNLWIDRDPNMVLELWTEYLCLKLVDLCRWWKIPKMWRKMSWKRTFRQHPDKGFINYSPKTSLISFYSSSLSVCVLFAYAALPLPRCMFVCLCTPKFSLPNLVQVRRRQTKWTLKLLRRIASWNSEPLWYFWIGMNLFRYVIVLYCAWHFLHVLKWLLNLFVSAQCI